MMRSDPTPASRIRIQNDKPIAADGGYVLYWMTAARRTRWNFGLQRAVELSGELRKPLIILEAVRLDYPHASARLHTFIIEGMRDNAHAIAGSRATWYPYIEPRRGEARGLVPALASQAAVVVTDWSPAFFLPRMTTAAAVQSAVRVEAVDSNGLIPIADHGRAFPTARGYRGLVQRDLPGHLKGFPEDQPLSGLQHAGAVVPAEILARWPPANLRDRVSNVVAALPVDHSVPPAPATGGPVAAERVLTDFLDNKLDRYAEGSRHPDEDCTSRLSPYLHFGHIAPHRIFAALMTRERWTTRKLQRRRVGVREGWWNVSAGAELFLEQLVVWRELAFNGAAWPPGFGGYPTLPAWARRTLEAHLDDPRPHLYTLAELDESRTSDPIWNAAQNELRQTGWSHGYMRMIWGKKILEWSREPAEALQRMALLMNRYALDGRDPVSDLNYAWVLGRYDRPWFERPVFGTVRFMTTESARRKLRMKAYLARYAGSPPPEV